MSYILDALNKADQARKEGEHETPSLPQHTSNIPANSHRGRGLFFVVALASLAMFFWLSPWQSETSHNQSIVTPSVKPIPAPQIPTQQPKQVNIEELESLSGNELELLPETAIQPAAIPNIMALPQSVLNALPPIKISAHTYSENADKRMVIINDKMLHEKKYISERLLLRSITKQGVELEFDGTIFTMEPLTSWPD